MILIKATAWSWSVCLLYVLFVGRVPFMNGLSELRPAELTPIDCSLISVDV